MNLIGLMVGLAVSAILATQAAASYVHIENQRAIQRTALQFEWEYTHVPALPADPSWTVNGSVWSKTLTRPAGVTLSITVPATIGGSFSCSVSGSPLYYAPRC